MLINNVTSCLPLKGCALPHTTILGSDDRSVKQFATIIYLVQEVAVAFLNHVINYFQHAIKRPETISAFL